MARNCCVGLVDVDVDVLFFKALSGKLYRSVIVSNTAWYGNDTSVQNELAVWHCGGVILRNVTYRNIDYIPVNYAGAKKYLPVVYLCAVTE